LLERLDRETVFDDFGEEDVEDGLTDAPPWPVSVLGDGAKKFLLERLEIFLAQRMLAFRVFEGLLRSVLETSHLFRAKGACGSVQGFGAVYSACTVRNHWRR
jgi:hypothetical protein